MAGGIDEARLAMVIAGGAGVNGAAVGAVEAVVAVVAKAAALATKASKASNNMLTVVESVWRCPLISAMRSLGSPQENDHH